MTLVLMLWLLAWIGVHARPVRAAWSDLGHRIALATTGGFVGLLSGLVLVQDRARAEPGWDLFTAGWPTRATVGLVHSADYGSTIGASTYGQPPFEGPHIEGALACTANFVSWGLAAFLLLALVPARCLPCMTAVSRFVPAAMVLAVGFFGPRITVE